MKWFNFFCLVAAISLTFLLARGVGRLPALGPLFSVNGGGIWSHRPYELNSQQLRGLKKDVVITFDDAGVPHVFAQNLTDLARAQGFLMASQRLFQMDLLTRLTAGRLSEWAGSRTQQMDEFFVKFGMRESAEKSLKGYMSDPETAEMFLSYVNGVNAFIEGLSNLPPEYRILGERPEKWEPIRISHMAKQLTFALAGRSFDVQLSQILKQIGSAKVLDLFPEFTPFDDIIYPWNGRVKRRAENSEEFSFVTRLENFPSMRMPASGNGSNNWAVSGKRSTTGFSLMANDTHLEHSLPNVWYEAQLTTPEFNVYGVGLAAVPGLINGFNQHVSWGPTNGTTDVLDYFEVEFADETSFRYRVNEEWLEADVRREEIRIKGARPKKIDVVWTQLGVLVHREGRYGLVARWAGHHNDNELKAIYNLFSSRSLDECLRSFATWAAPIQNFICADKRDVAIQHAGFIPHRKVGEGRFIMAPSGPMARDFRGGISDSERPRTVRPSSGIVLSANQRVVDANYPHYLGWDFEEPFRGRMIRRRLEEKNKISPEDMMAIQNDDFDGQAELVLPRMLEGIVRAGSLIGENKSALEELAKWNFQVNADDWRPALYKEWFKQFKKMVFDDEYQVSHRMLYPKDSRVIALLENLLKDPRHPDRDWVDDKKSERFETLSEVLSESFLAAYRTLASAQGLEYRKWKFSKWSQVEVPHVAKLPGFGISHLQMNGSGESIRGNKGRHGAVYKIVVAHGDWPKAWIQVPGGNDGDPFSKNYERHVEAWARGEMREAEFYKNVAEAKTKASRVVVLSP